ncbi:MAG: hypothetical protein K0R99_4009 [Microbacterium sp.]|uniref:DUF3631 domain-containing protein n=1 Tax=Microbacterium sp. TaxID=51671 RepID=UPI00261D9826|nr:DUF3631 domain-containing protein [Microbacterium sp.]MDF2562563.1 hypothetical protein [Microbacterium sp.]
MIDGSTVPTVPDGSKVSGVLNDIRRWLERYICVVDELDIDVLTLWAAHTHVAFETYTTPRLVLDSTMPGSGKTTVLEHLQRLALRPIQAASISSPALLARMLDKEMRTILIDEVDRSLDPKKPGVEDLIAILNSGYKRGATRPVLVPSKGGEWDVSEMSTFSPVAMAGNAPHLPDDTRSRSIRVLLMPDVYGTVSPSDWEELEPDAIDLGTALAEVLDQYRNAVREARPELPAGCTGRMREKWNPLARVAAVAGSRWPAVVAQLIERDIYEVEMERAEGLLNLPPGMVLLKDLFAVWEDVEPFLPTSTILERLVQQNPEYWGDASAYGKRLTAQRMGRLIVQATKIHSTKNAMDVRGYARDRFAKAWRQLGITLPDRPSGTVGTVEPSMVVAA